MIFILGLLILIDWKRDSYNSTLVIVYQLRKMVYYKEVKIIFDALRLKVIIIGEVVF